MAMACPVDLDILKLRSEIQSIYARVAADPSGEFHFHRGPEYAATRLGYDAAELATIPRTVTESFAGVGNPHAIGSVPAGVTVVDIGSGAGTDLLLAAVHVGPTGRAIGVDMTEAMRERARRGAAARPLTHRLRHIDTDRASRRADVNCGEQQVCACAGSDVNDRDARWHRPDRMGVSDAGKRLGHRPRDCRQFGGVVAESCRGVLRPAMEMKLP